MDDALAPVRGVVNGFVMSMIVWCVLLAIVYMW